MLYRSLCYMMHILCYSMLYVYMIYVPRMPRSRWFLSVPDVGRQCARVSRPAGDLPGYGPVNVPLLYQLLAQHIPDRTTVRWTLFRRNVSPDSARWL